MEPAARIAYLLSQIIQFTNTRYPQVEGEVEGGVDQDGPKQNTSMPVGGKEGIERRLSAMTMLIRAIEGQVCGQTYTHTTIHYTH